MPHLSNKLPEGQVLTELMLTIFSTPFPITITMYSRDAFNFIIFDFPDVIFTKLLYSLVNGGLIANSENSNALTPHFFQTDSILSDANFIRLQYFHFEIRFEQFLFWVDILVN